jgi:tRNA threonylcarbamoyladenosine biosynthesis protein TsaB
VEPEELQRIVVGTGPGSFTSLRMGLAAGRALAFALDAQVAGVSTLEALAAGAPAALPVIDARRREVFTLIDGNPVATLPNQLSNSLLQGRTCVGDGAVRYREVLEAAGAEIPPDDSELHVPRASVHARLAADFGPAELVEPIYVRVPDADRKRS